MPVLRQLRQGDCEFEASLGCTAPGQNKWKSASDDGQGYCQQHLQPTEAVRYEGYIVLPFHFGMLKGGGTRHNVFFIYMNVLPACMYVYHKHALCPQRSKGINSPRAGVTNGCGLPGSRDIGPPGAKVTMVVNCPM
uniref:Bm11818 n=1 Tax=Brugia malayi TaxID=6279 RepID=A0A1I9GA23_BRUMA|nr:Bm11818 [Brugia malayi]